MSDEGFNWELSMEDALDLDFPGWQPQPGDKVMGTVLNVSMSEEGQWGSYPIIAIATKEGGVSVHCFHSVLRKATAHAEVGDLIGIKYKGRRQGANQSYEDYNVIVQHQGGALTGGPVSQALPKGESAGADDPEPEGWDTPAPAEAMSTPQQHAAINKLRAAAGGDPIDWEASEVSEAEAARMIEELS